MTNKLEWNIILGGKGLPSTNTLAFLVHSLVMKKMNSACNKGEPVFQPILSSPNVVYIMSKLGKLECSSMASLER
jgi:hypothetical protein